LTYLFLHIFFLCCFNNFLRLGQARDGRTMAFGSVNYILATLLMLVALPFFWHPTWDRITVISLVLGLLNGLLFYTNLVLILAAFKRAGTGITWAFIGSSIIIPILASRFIWHEAMGYCQWIAVIIVPVAVWLMRPGNRKVKGQVSTDSQKTHVGIWTGLLLVGCMLGGGSSSLLHKFQDVYAPDGRAFYQLVIFFVASALTVGHMLKAGIRPRRREINIGLAAGLANVLALSGMLLGIAHLPTALFFTLAGSGTIIINTLTGRLFWRERISHRQKLGLLVAIAIVVLANIKESPAADSAAGDIAGMGLPRCSEISTRRPG
jgi:glucose uptake protein GlcU